MPKYRSLFLLSLFIIVFSCKDGDGDPNPTVTNNPGKLQPAIASILPEKAVDGDTLTVQISHVNGKVFSMLKIAGVDVTPISVQDSTIKAVVPYLTSGGKKSVVAYFHASDSTKVDQAFEYLPFVFKGVKSTVVPVPAPGKKSTLVILAENVPKDLRAFSILSEMSENGEVTISKHDDYWSFFKIDKVTSEGIELQLLRDPREVSDITYSFYFKYRDQEHELSDLSFPGYYKIWKTSYTNVPENELELLRGNRTFSDAFAGISNVYLGGKKLKTYFHWPIEDMPGYHSLESFAVPADLAPGEYELKVYEMDGTTEILSDSLTTITITDITYCPEKPSYAPGEDVKIKIHPYLNPYQCFSCPEEILINDDNTSSVYSGSIKEKDWIDDKNIYLLMEQPSDLPASGTFSLSLKSPNGYVYKVTEGCLGDGKITVE